MTPLMQSPPLNHPTGSYTVSTPVFEGPLDLLLQLIERAELDISVLSLALVTDQFLDYIHQMPVPAEEISSFLVVAAKLLQIKSESLLPRAAVREAAEEELGEDLAEQLRIYRRFKELSLWLDNRQQSNLRTFLRLAPVPQLAKRLDLSNITLDELIQAAEEIFSGEAEKEALGTVITPPLISIRDKIGLITQRLGIKESASFKSLLGERPTRLEVVVTFLALLELIKRYRVAVLQDELFGDIQIEREQGWNPNEELEIEFE